MTAAPPPSADSKLAEKYLQKLIPLIDQDKLMIQNTDLSQFDPGALQDHYWADLGNYRIEVSHSKQPDSGADSYVIIFTNVKHLREDENQKVILAYMHLDTNQFIKFKSAAKDQIERNQQAINDKKVEEALQPVDQVLDDLYSSLTPQTQAFASQLQEEKSNQEPEEKSDEEKTLTSLGSSFANQKT